MSEPVVLGPSFSRIRFVGFSVRDLARSAAWYRETLGCEVLRENWGSSAWQSSWDEVLLLHRASGVEIGLMHHPTNDGAAFSEFRTGLDHLEFEVSTLDELDAWRQRLDGLGIPHSGRWPHIVTFRDPDNIQLEFFYRTTGTASGGGDAASAVTSPAGG